MLFDTSVRSSTASLPELTSILVLLPSFKHTKLFSSNNSSIT
uniref:Uncharacterized protein n=1 Tax=Anguilla anguilla TaxID=7936 RepID=A0A0E9WNR7_ANGAN